MENPKRIPPHVIERYEKLLNPQPRGLIPNTNQSATPSPNVPIPTPNNRIGYHRESLYNDNLNKGDDSYNKSNYEKAINYYQEAIKWLPDNSYIKEAYSRLGNAYFQNYNYKKQVNVMMM